MDSELKDILRDLVEAIRDNTEAIRESTAAEYGDNGVPTVMDD
jgi:hypothetical protein